MKVLMHCSYNDNGSLTMVPVTPFAGYEPDPSNAAFFIGGPGGSMNLGTLSEEAAASFEAGKQYYVEFTEAPAVVPVVSSAS